MDKKSDTYACELELKIQPDHRPGVVITIGFCSAMEVAVFLISAGLYSACVLCDDCMFGRDWTPAIVFMTASVAIARLAVVSAIFIGVSYLNMSIESTWDRSSDDEGDEDDQVVTVLDKEKVA